MLEAGTLENVYAIFGLHVEPSLPAGEVFSRPGPILAGGGYFEALISGKGGHAAIPQHSIDPILAASNVILSLQHIVSREADPLDSQVCRFFSNIQMGLSLNANYSFQVRLGKLIPKFRVLNGAACCFI